MGYENELRGAQRAVERITAKMEALARQLRSYAKWHEPGYYDEGAEYASKVAVRDAMTEIADAIDSAFEVDSNKDNIK